MTGSMTSKQVEPSRFLRFVRKGLGILAALILSMPGAVFATHFELSRLAGQIELISGQLAHDLRYTGNYGSVRQHAVTLSREASQLVDTLRRNRSNSRVRSRFKDVRRGYERLEQAFFRADGRDHVPHLYREVNQLSNLFTNLNDEFYYAGLGGQSYGSDNGYNYSNPNRGNPNRSSIIISSRNYNYGNYGSPAPGRIMPHRERAMPPAFRGNTVRPNRQGGRGSNARIDRGRYSQGSRSGLNAPYDHSSPVLERQGRQIADRRALENQAHHNRSSVSGRQSARGEARGGRAERGQRVRSDRVTSTETRRRNHFD